MGGSHDRGSRDGGGTSCELGRSRDQWGHDVMEGNGGHVIKGHVMGVGHVTGRAM